MSRPLDVESVAAHLHKVFPALDATGQRLSLALYRELAQGAPVALPRLASLLGLPVDEVGRRLQAWPGVLYDDAQRVIGYWGLALSRTTHRLRTDGRDLYTWCAWDTLFLPALLGTTAEVRSVCRGSGEPVELTVGPSAVESGQSAGLWVSFVLPEADAVRANLVASFCHYVHFFRSREAASPWLKEHPGTFLLSLADAYEVGRRRNHLRYGGLLALA
jgi:alkylmercury lyase